MASTRKVIPLFYLFRFMSLLLLLIIIIIGDQAEPVNTQFFQKIE